MASIITAGGATTFCTGGSVTLSGNVGGVWSNAATTASINVTTTGHYYVTNTNVCGSVISNHILVTVNLSPAANAGANRAICLNTSTQIGAIAVPGNTYSWISIPVGFISAIANPNVSPLVTTTYTLTETVSGTGCQYSNSVTVTVDTAPIIVVQPSNQSACIGTSVSFSVTATGTGLTYQWRRGVVNLINGGNFSGVTTAILTINPVNLSDGASDYNVVINGICSPIATSANVALNINITPIACATACVGSSISFSVPVVATGLTYQWRRGVINLINGVNISGATSAILMLPGPASEHKQSVSTTPAHQAVLLAFHLFIICLSTPIQVQQALFQVLVQYVPVPMEWYILPYLL
ncbi:MAG: hypothetical protein WCK09_21595 [Bacteroidota bacterium]